MQSKRASQLFILSSWASSPLHRAQDSSKSFCPFSDSLKNILALICLSGDEMDLILVLVFSPGSASEGRSGCAGRAMTLGCNRFHKKILLLCLRPMTMCWSYEWIALCACASKRCFKGASHVTTFGLLSNECTIALRIHSNWTLNAVLFHSTTYFSTMYSNTICSNTMHSWYDRSFRRE